MRPVLEILGHDFEAQIPLQGLVGTKQRDYVFYRMPRF